MTIKSNNLVIGSVARGLATLALGAYGAAQEIELQSDLLGCGGPAFFGETITSLPVPQSGLSVAYSSPLDAIAIIVLDFAAPCHQFHPGAEFSNFAFGGLSTPLQTLPLGLVSFMLPGGTLNLSVALSPDPVLLNVPFALQFLRHVPTCPPGLSGCTPGAWDFGPSYDMVWAGRPLARDHKHPQPNEKMEYGEDDSQIGPGHFQPFASLGQSASGRSTFLVALPQGSSTPCAIQPGYFCLLSNGSTVVIDGQTNDPRMAPELRTSVQNLAALVQYRWRHRGYLLRVTSAKREPSSDSSYHQYGRAVDLSLADAAGCKLTLPLSTQALYLDRLSRLAIESGLDWVWHEAGEHVADPACVQNPPACDHVHASVHTGGPVVRIDSVSSARAIGPARKEWTVAVTCSDTDGVWQVFGEVLPSGAALPLGSPFFNPSPRLSIDNGAPPNPGQFTITVDASAGVVQNCQATLHVWARDSFGSYAINNSASIGQRRPIAATMTVVDVGIPLANMIPIPAGTFTMGPTNDPFQQPWTPHQVTISRPFWISRHEVTQAEYSAVMGTNPSAWQGANMPVESVSWDQAVSYCSALTAQESANGHLTCGYVYRLPTEAEWEYCCRAGTVTPYSFGSTFDCLMGNFHYILCGRPGPVHTMAIESFPANAWGIFDMHGNVAEWCLDSTQGGGEDYSPAPVVDPVILTGAHRRLRYSCYNTGDYESTSYYRFFASRSYVGSDVGFRVVLAHTIP